MADAHICVFTCQRNGSGDLLRSTGSRIADKGVEDAQRRGEHRWRDDTKDRSEHQWRDGAREGGAK